MPMDPFPVITYEKTPCARQGVQFADARGIESGRRPSRQSFWFIPNKLSKWTNRLKMFRYRLTVNNR